MSQVRQASTLLKLNRIVSEFANQENIKGLIMLLETEDEGMLIAHNKAGYELVGAIEQVKLEILNQIYSEV